MKSESGLELCLEIYLLPPAWLDPRAVFILADVSAVNVVFRLVIWRVHLVVVVIESGSRVARAVSVTPGINRGNAR